MSLPLTFKTSTAKAPSAFLPALETSSGGPSPLQPKSSRAELAGSDSARPRVPSRLATPSRQRGARLGPPPPPLVRANSTAAGSSASGTGCRCSALLASPQVAADLESGSMMPWSASRSMRSSKSQPRTSTPPTDFTTMPTFTPFTAAWPMASPLYRSVSCMSRTTAPLPPTPGEYRFTPKGRRLNSTLSAVSASPASSGLKLGSPFIHP
mmetsp:Transcript_94136/g.304141  ORF Transcript_94136/g.304141 Transcript_94136/m.304141 type:complete len:210 (-) Transcript_94136:552-1181(-)